MELFQEIVRESAWAWLVACICAAFGCDALVREYLSRRAPRSESPPPPSRRIEQFEQLARQAVGQGLGALPAPGAVRGDKALRWAFELASRGMPPEQLKCCLDGEIERRIVQYSHARRFAGLSAAACRGFGLCGIAFATVFALRQIATSGGPTDMAWPAFIGTIAGFVGLLGADRFLAYAQRSVAGSVLDLVLVAAGVEAIVAGEDPGSVRTRLARLLPSQEPRPGLRRAA